MSRSTGDGWWKQMLPLILTHIHTETQPIRCQQQSHSALPRPDNGWRVWGVKSNETSREQQLSVCVEVGDGGGVESRHECPCQSQGQTREGELRWPQQQAQNGCQSTLRKKETAVPRSSSLPSAWLARAHVRQLRQAGRPSGWTGTVCRAELQFVRVGFWQLSSKAETVREVWRRFWLDSETFTHFPMFSSLAPSLYLIGWEN